MAKTTFTLSTTIQPAIRRVLDASRIDGNNGPAWLRDPDVDTVRKACLLNILAVLAVTPTPATPLLTDVLAVFAVRADRIYAMLRTDVRETLEDYVSNARMPFYKDFSPVLDIHREILAQLPPWIEATAFQHEGPMATRLTSFRAEGSPSLQIVMADSPYPYTVADLDLDAHNPLQDMVGFFGHLWELVRGRRSGKPTDQLAMRATLSRGPAAACLCYTLV